MRRSFIPLVVVGFLAAACEEGPEQIYKPNPDNLDVPRFNGFLGLGHQNTGDQNFKWETSGQKTGTSVICQADEQQKRLAKMKGEPILPMRGAGGLNMLGDPAWSGLTIDQAQQILCQATAIGSGYLYWGDAYELVAWYDVKTRLINTLGTFPGYEGTLKANAYEVILNKPLQKDGKDLTDPMSDANVRAMNTELLKVFRPEVNNPEGRDCITMGTCYVKDWYTVKVFVFLDLGLYVSIEPKNLKVTDVQITLNRNFEFSRGNVEFVSSPMPTAGLPPVPKINYNECQLTFGMTWGDLLSKCVGIDPPEKAQSQPAMGNEIIYTDMGNLTVYLKRPSLGVDQILPDSVKTESTDEIWAFAFIYDYEGTLAISRASVFTSFFAALNTAVKNAVKNEIPSMDLTDRFSKVKHTGDAATLATGKQVVQDCNPTCVEDTLINRARAIVENEVVAEIGTLPQKLKDPNFYVEIFLRALLAPFNGNQPPTASEVYFSTPDDTADYLDATFSRKFNDQRYTLLVRYHNKMDQIINISFYKGGARPEAVLDKDAELTGKGFRLGELIKSPRLGMKNEMSVNTLHPEIQRALVNVALEDPENPTQVLVGHHKEDGLSGFQIPVDGKRSLFVPAAMFYFRGIGHEATFYANVIQGEKPEDDYLGITSIASESFHDKLPFCGTSVGLWDSVDEVLGGVDPSCSVIVNYSDNGKFIEAFSTTTTGADGSTLGLRFSVIAGRVSAARYWVE